MILYFILTVGLATALWNLYYRRFWAKNITVSLHFEADALYAGDGTVLIEAIENRGRLPVPVLEVGFHVERELDFADEENTHVSDYLYKRDIFAVQGRQKITRPIPLKCARRGYFEIREAELVTHSLLYRKRLGTTRSSDAALYVYAEMTNVSDIMPLCERMLGTLQCARRLYEDPFAFRTIRGYTPDDPMKTINWKASAKTGSLMVNTFDSALSQRAMLFLDVADTGILKYRDLVEESIAVAASLARRLLRQGIETGLCFNGCGAGHGLSGGHKSGIGLSGGHEAGAGLLNGFTPTNKREMLIRMEHMLAEYRISDGSYSYKEEMDKYRPSEDTLLIFITKNMDPPLAEAIKKRAGENQAVIVCPVYRGESLREDAAAAAKGSRNIHLLVREVEKK